tara:strand:+ start:368 stop:1729 length:1362 start_codon:yes stop_codon:yes gene_type:complete
MARRLLFILLFIPLFFSCSKETINYTLTVNVNPPEGGFVNPNGGTVPEGQQISLQATASSQYVFENWSGDETGTSSNISIIMDGNKTLTANFRIDPFYFDDNGVTIKARDWVTAGTKGILNGVEYTAVDLDMLKEFMYDKKDLSKVVTTLVTDMNRLFYPPVDSNGDGRITCDDSFFHEFNENIGSWDVSNVVDMSFMFYSAKSFNQDISRWEVSNVINMRGQFQCAQSFNKNIGAWNVSNVTNMNILFLKADSFNQDIGNWDVSKVKDMGGMFYNNPSFNQYIGSWDVSSVEDMNQMFGIWNRDSSFNQDISNWDVSNVKYMYGMFLHNSSFNQDIGDWDVSNVLQMHKMFEKSIFNQDIGNWDVSNVIYMSEMFKDANQFNQDISNWNVSNLVNENNPYNSGLFSMFENAINFNQDLTKWCVESFTNEPNNFALNSDLLNSNKPKWGEPCN